MSAFPGDEVFFHHQNEPKSGRVVSTGKHGCVVDAGGKQHKLKWEHVLGHKKHSDQQFKVEEHGADGLIVKDMAGKRRFIGIPKEAKAEQLTLAKSIGAGAVMLKSGISGKVVGKPGRDGAHVRDSTGAIHKVLWRDMNGF